MAATVAQVREVRQDPTRESPRGEDRVRFSLTPTAPPSSSTVHPNMGSGHGWVLRSRSFGVLVLAAGVGVGIWALTRDSTVEPPPTTTGWTVQTILGL